MKASNEKKKEIKKEMKLLIKKVNDSPLNRFLLDYYDGLKYEELDEARDGVEYKINFHKRLIKDLKKELKSSKSKNKDIKNIEDYIDELEYSKRTSFEIIKVIKAKKSYFELKNQLKNLKNNNKKINCRRLFAGLRSQS